MLNLVVRKVTARLEKLMECHWGYEARK